MQLVTENRGAHSIITTFEGRPYDERVLGQRDRAVPGRRAHLDHLPLPGAAVGDPERPHHLRRLRGRLQHLRHRSARARWRGCCRATTREVDEGWLCDRGRYAITHLRAEDRVTHRPDPRRPRARGGRRRPTRSTTSPSGCAPPLREVRRGLGRGARLRRADQRGGPRLGRGSWPRGWAAASALPAPRAAPAGTRSSRTWRRSPTSTPPTRSWSPATPTSASGRRCSSCGSARPSAEGARVITVGAGGTRLETLRGASHISTAAPAPRTRPC